MRFASIILGILLSMSTVIAAEPSSAELEQLRNDCWVEGQSAGLRGKDLDSFVESCVADLVEVSFSNQKR